MADFLTQEEPLTQAPPKWSAVEESDKYKSSSNADRKTAFGKWDSYSRKYAQQQGLWDDENFRKGYIEKSDKVSSQFNTLWDTFGDNVKLYHSARNFLDPAIEFGSRVTRGAETSTKGSVSATYDVASKATEQYRNPYLNKTPQDATIDIPVLTKQIDDLEGQVAKDFGGVKISDPYSPEAQNLAGLSSKLAKTRNQLAQAQAASAGVVKEGFAGNLSRATEDLSSDWQGKKAEAGDKYKGLIDASKDSRFAMQLAESVGQSIPGTAASILNPAMGLGVMYMQQYDQSKDEYAKKMEEQGKPVDPVQQTQYAHAQAFGQTPFEVVGDVALAGAVKKIFKAIPQGTVEGGVKSFGKWIGEQAKHLIAPTLGEVAITTPAQSLVQDVVAEKYGIQSPTTIGEKLAKIPEQQALALAQSVLMGGAPVGVAAIARSSLSPEQKTKTIETKLKTEELAKNNAPLTAQALAKSTADALVTEDPNLVSDLIDESAPAGTFVDEAKANEKFAPPETRTPEEARAALPATLQPSGIAPVTPTAPQSEGIAPVNPEIAPVTLPNEPTPIAGPAPDTIAVTPAAGPTEPVLPATQPQPAAQAVPMDVAPAVGEVSAVSPGVRQEVIPNARIQPIQPTPDVSGITEPRVGGPITELQSEPRAVARPVAATKPSSQSTSSFTPEQNVSHQAFIDAPAPPLIAAEEAKHFSAWAKENVPKRPIVLYNNEGKTAVISKSPKPDRKYQVTFMDQGNEGGSEAFHDIAAQSVDEGVAEAYRRGFTDTQKYKTYERASTNREAGKGNAGPNLERGNGQRPGELPGTSKEVRAEVSAPGPVPTNEEHLQRASSIRVEAPTGATFVRATDAQGRVSEEPIKSANKGLNIFQGAGPWVKVDAGTRDAKGNFVPIEGPVTVQDRAPADLEKKTASAPKNQQAKRQKAVTPDTSPDPYNGAKLDDRPPLRPEQNTRLISELGRVGALDDNATAKSVLEFLSTDRKTPEWSRTLSGVLAKSADNLSIEVVYRPQSTWAALYANGRILINTAARNPGVAATILHEAAHHVTLAKIEGKATLGETEKAALGNLQDLFDKARKLGGKDYGFTNLAEFVSEAFSNAGFRSKLDNLTLEGDRVSLLQRLANAIARLVWGRPVATGSLLEAAMQNAMDLAGEPVIESSSAPMEQQRESALGMAGSWVSSLFHPNASQEATARAAGQLLQATEVPAAPTEQEIKPLTPEQAKLVTDNLALAGFFADQFSNIPGTSRDERNSEARMALIKAAQTFDPSKGAFKDYSSMAARNSMRNLYRKNARKASREVSANTSIGDEEDIQLQDTLEARPETPPINSAAIELINKAKSALSPRDQKIMDDYASGMVLRDVAERHRLSHEGVRKIIKTAGKKIIAALNEAGITDIESIFPKQEERTQALPTKRVSPVDEAVPVDTVGQLEAKDIERQQALPDVPIEADLVAPLSPQGQETKVPWFTFSEGSKLSGLSKIFPNAMPTVKAGEYRPVGKALSAAGRWSKEIFEFKKEKDQKTRAAFTHLEFADKRLKNNLNNNFIKKKIAAPIDELNTAFGSAENKLTKDQVDEASKIQDQQARDGFLQTARLANLDEFKQRQRAALLSLPPDLQVLVTEWRDAVDALSRELINRGDITDGLKFTIDENLNTYQHRSYAIFDSNEHVKWVMSDDPDAKRIRNRVEALFTQDARSRAAVEYGSNQRKAGTPVTKAQAMAHVQNLDVSSEVSKMIHDYKSVADGSVLDIIRGKVPGQSGRGILKVRGMIPREIRDFWGEHKDLSVNYAKTYSSLSIYLNDLDFKTKVLNDGLQKGYLWKEGVSTGPFPDNVVQLFGEGSKSMGPLDGVYGPPMLRDAFAELNQQYTKDWLTTMTSFALQAKTKYSNVATARNFLGNGAIMGLTGNLLSGDYRKSAFATMANFRKLGSKEMQEYVTDAVKHGIIGDNVGPGALREMAQRSAMLKDLPVGSLVKPVGKWVDQTAGATYSAADDFWKIFAWEGEKHKLKWAVPTLTEAENKQRAAAIVRRVVPTYSEAFKWSQDLFGKNILGKIIAPFTTFTTEIVRTTAGNIRQASEEIASGIPRLQYIGAKRLAWTFATYLGFKAAVSASKYLSGYDDDDDEALRRQLPDWQKKAMLLYLPRTKDGHPRFLDISYLNPYNYVFDPIDTVVNAVMHGKQAAEMGKDAIVSVVKQIFAPFISDQLFMGAVGDVRHNKKPSGAEIHNEMDSWEVRLMKDAAYVGKALMPGAIASEENIRKSLIGYKERGGKEYDTLSEFISLAGQRVTAHDPKQSFQYQVGEFNRKRQSSAYLFSYIANSQGTVDPGDVARAYLAANKANKQIAQDLRLNYKAAQKLGVSKANALQTLKSGNAGMDAMREAESGVYTKYTPGDEILKEIRAKFPQRYQEFLKVYGSTPATEALE